MISEHARYSLERDEEVPRFSVAILSQDPPHPCGIHPVGDKVLVLPDEIEEVTKGGIIIAPAHVERSQHARTLGTFVAAGSKAWIAFGPEPWARAGDRVMFARFGGIAVKGKDGKTYRILNDIDITATVDAGVTVGGSEL